MLRRILCATVLVLFLESFGAADHWSHWRGEAGNGISSTASPPTQWSETTNVKWRTAIPGRGSGSPVIWNNRVFVVSAVSRSGQRGGRMQFVLFCFDRESGDLVWKRQAIETTPHEGAHRTNSFASASPCTDGKYVYAHFGSRGLYCFTMDGQQVWERQLGKMKKLATFGEGSSPTIVEDKLIVPWDHEEQSYLFALNRTTGKTIWRTPRDEPSCWATPLIIEHEGRKQVIMNGQNYARAYDLESGRELWRCGGQAQRPIASAVSDNGLIFIGSGFRGSFLGAFRPNGNGDIEGTSSVVWTVQRDAPDIASPLLSSGRLYFFKGKTGLFSCYDAATGKPHYRTQRTGLQMIYASPVAAGGYVFLTGRSGKTVVIKDANQYEVVSVNSVGEGVDATPALVDKQLFLRGEEHLFCISL